jgi:hypothetical protein
MALERRSQYRPYTDCFVGIDFIQPFQLLTQKITHDNSDVGHLGRIDDRVQPGPGARNFINFNLASLQHGSDRHHAFRDGNFLLLNQKVIIMPQLINEYLLDAVAIISASEVPEEEFADAVNAQARLMAGVTSDDYWDDDTEMSIQ